MITCQREILFQVVEEIDPLLQANHAELTSHRELVLSPNWAQYRQLEQLGLLYGFTLRDEGRLVGYSAFFMAPHLQYADLNHATNTVLYIAPSYRAKAGVRFLRFQEQQMEQAGAQFITLHVKPQNDFRPLLRRLGYGDEEYIMSKILGEPNGS